MKDWLLSNSKSDLREYVRTELLAQLARLRATGLEKIEYLDGHHHIHVVPGLIGALQAILKQAEITQVRLPYSRALWFSRHWALALLATFARRDFKTFGLRPLAFFYPKERHFLDLGTFATALAKQKVPTEVIVHPALRADANEWEHADPYVAPRVTEYRALDMLNHLFKKDHPA
ncbi:MAG TPA: hypothetical protein DCS07_00430 [Bdellovibrionales bacterium]|nr:hypothetical protein [Bdellovibrionales bacterium]